MNTLRQIFTARTLAALRQTSLVNSLPVDNATPNNRLSTIAATVTNGNVFLPKEDFTNRLLRDTPLGLAKNPFLKNYKQLDKKLEIVYRCMVCNTRNIKTISEAAYSKGVVILQCDGCSTTHLIVDNLGWFANCKGKTVSEVLAEKGEFVRRIVLNEKGEVLRED